MSDFLEGWERALIGLIILFFVAGLLVGVVVGWLAF